MLADSDSDVFLTFAPWSFIFGGCGRARIFNGFLRFFIMRAINPNVATDRINMTTTVNNINTKALSSSGSVIISEPFWYSGDSSETEILIKMLELK